ncbi:MAG: dihydrofolate reductase [Opitutales bacterium]|nr:dihydrofolate reductase [Opitutales bacterium]
MDNAAPIAESGSVNIIVACDENRLIGRNGRLPWRIREDWLWFMRNIEGGACVIGRVCYEAMLGGGHVNEKRRYYVVSRDESLAGEHTEVFSSTAEALAAARASGRPVWICGGVSIYGECLPLADRLYLTQVHHTFEGDAWMPDWSGHFGKEIFRRDSSDSKYSYSFIVMDRF